MLKVSDAVRQVEVVRPLLALLDAQLARPEEVARHLRYDVQHLANLRRSKCGPPYLKIGAKGAIRYRVSEILEWEIIGHGGGITIDRLALALATMPDLTLTTAAKTVEHCRVFFGLEWRPS